MIKVGSELFDRKERVLSMDVAIAGEKTCNGKLSTRDGYCQQSGIAPFKRCKDHGGQFTEQSMDFFKKSVGIEDAAKLEVLIEDVLNMDNELASAKTMLLRTLEEFRRADDVLKAYMDNTPERPIPGASPVEVETYSSAVNLHEMMIDTAMKLKKSSYAQSIQLINVLSQGVAKNKKIKEGSKFQIDARQVASILKVQINAMRANCKGCPKLKDVLKSIQDGTKDIPLESNFSDNTKRALGRRTYNEMVEKVQNIQSAIEQSDYAIDE